VRIRYTEEAINDLERLRAFVEAKNLHAAKRIAAELLDGIGNLAIFPDMGLPVGRAPDPRFIRDLFVGDYTIRYLREAHSIVILRLWHGRENEKESNGP
jgi:plasmid stabilization system protein ParE